jgi:predicted permease
VDSRLRGNDSQSELLLLNMQFKQFMRTSKLSALLMISFTLGAQLAGLFIGNPADWTSVQIAYSTLLGGLVLFTVAVWMIRYRTAQSLCK